MLTQNLNNLILHLRLKIQKRYWSVLQQFNGSVFPVDIYNPKLGFFAHMNVAVRLLRFAEENSLSPQIRFTSPNYRDPRLGNNWLHYHFAENLSVPASRRLISFRFIINTHRSLNLSYPDDLSLQETRDLIFRHLEPIPEITSNVERFCQENNISSSTIAVHYRGTDKSLEADRLDYEQVFIALETYFQTAPTFSNIFVASDEEQFITAIRKRFTAIPIVSLDDFSRSRDGTPVHQSGLKEGNLEMGKDALKNVLVMARCSTIFRTSSLLSSWVSVFNPAIHVFLLSKAYRNCNWFPERVIEKQASFWDSDCQRFL